MFRMFYLAINQSEIYNEYKKIDRTNASNIYKISDIKKIR